MNHSIDEWVKAHSAEALKYHIKPENFNDYKVLPRLLFGKYLSDQFAELINKAEKEGIITIVHTNTTVIDMI